MTKLEELMKLNHVEKPKPKTEMVEIAREEFDLLSVEQEVTYHIIEEDGTITIKKGVNM